MSLNNQSTVIESQLQLSSQVAYSKLLIAVCGVYSWEFLITLWFEWSFLFSSPRRNFKLPYVSYFICRYSFLTSVIILVSLYHVTVQIECQTVAQLAQVLLNISLGAATLNLLFRAWAFWRHVRALVGLLVVFAIGQWVLLIWNMLSIRSTWNRTIGMCMVSWVKQESLLALYIYTMLFNLLVSILCVIGVWRSKATDSTKSSLLQRLGHQGICYFGATCTANLIPVFFLVLNVNPVLNVISTVPACAMTVIAASRAITVIATLVDEQNSGTSAVSMAQVKGPGKFPNSGLPSEYFAKTKPLDEEAHAEPFHQVPPMPTDRLEVPAFGTRPVHIIDFNGNRNSGASDRSSNTYAEHHRQDKNAASTAGWPRT